MRYFIAKSISKYDCEELFSKDIDIEDKNDNLAIIELCLNAIAENSAELNDKLQIALSDIDSRECDG